MKTLVAFYIFLVLMSAKPAVPLTSAQKVSTSAKAPLRFVGEIEKVENFSESVADVAIDVSLRLTISNIGNEPIIIYRNQPWLGAIDVAASIEDASAYKYLSRSSAWHSVWGESDRLQLRQKLDQAFPPSDITLVLKPGEFWTYEKIVGISFDKKENYNGTRKAWSEIKRHNPLWIQVTQEMWPVNAEPELNPRNLAWGKKLRERWRNAGHLWLDRLTSEPIRLNPDTIKN
jgi:hypothetical protein